MSTEEQGGSGESAEDLAARLVAAREWPVLVTLGAPIDFGSQRISSLEFRKGRMGDLKGMPMQAPSLDQLILLASRMCGQPVKVIEMLGDEDAPEVLQIALGFFARCLGAGKTR
jgi:hypothetical protein